MPWYNQDKSNSKESIMEKIKLPFAPAGILFLLYYLLLPCFLGFSGLPFISSLLSVSSLAYLGLGVVLLLKKPALPTAVFTLICAFTQLSPVVYFAAQLIKGAWRFGGLSLLNALCQLAAFLLMTVFALCLAVKEPKVRIINGLWWIPVLLSALSAVLYFADQLWRFFLADEVVLSLMVLNLVLAFLLSAATALTSVWLFLCGKRLK
jgi:hypothetical protein